MKLSKMVQEKKNNINLTLSDETIEDIISSDIDKDLKNEIKALTDFAGPNKAIVSQQKIEITDAELKAEVDSIKDLAGI